MRPISILYVEDNDDVRESIAMLLESEGREVVSRANGEDALAALEERRFDVVVTDVSLPGISGTDLTRRVLATDPRHWVVLCSGFEFRQALNQLGPNVRSLPKPFDPAELQALMNEIITSIRVDAAG